VALSIPLSEAQRLSRRPLKWLRYITFAVCGAQGDLCTNEEGNLVDYNLGSGVPLTEDYYYFPNGNIPSFKFCPCPAESCPILRHISSNLTFSRSASQPLRECSVAPISVDMSSHAMATIVSSQDCGVAMPPTSSLHIRVKWCCTAPVFEFATLCSVTSSCLMLLSKTVWNSMSLSLASRSTRFKMESLLRKHCRVSSVMVL
jgi:hypothetical protein